MSEPVIKGMKDIPSEHILGAGTALCAGCGALQALHEIYDVLGENTVFVNSAGCMTLMSVYPFTPFRGGWLYTAMASAPAGAQGVRDALDILLAKKRIAPEEDMQVAVLSGDGATYGMGLAAASCAIDRDLDFLYICYDNEGYGNTGNQTSAGTPHASRTATDTGAEGVPGYKKDLFGLWVANRPAYAATVIGAEPLDLARKVEKAKSIKGPKLILALSPCPVGWDYDPMETLEIGRLAVKTGIWPLKEFVDGKVVHTKTPHPRTPVEEYLKLQGRYAHLFSPKRNDALIDEIQSRVDAYWDAVGD
ncbi:MAG: pyruvate synthase [Alphaproteobacteria bacterium]|nr:pyruvate synthase [Alphaproteobacteria bacterium]